MTVDRVRREVERSHRGALHRIAASAAVLACIVAASASADPPCKEGFKSSSERIHPDIKLHRHECGSPPYRAFILEVDLTSKKLGFCVTPYNKRRLVPSEFAERVGAVAATNGGFWISKWGGFTVSDGKRWPKGDDNDVVTVVGFGKYDESEGRVKVDIRPTDEVLEKPLGWMDQALSGVPLVLDDGQVQKQDHELFLTRHPRTGIGYTKDGKTLFLAVVDGRQGGWSWGLRTWQLGELFDSLGAYRALNLDGGSSSTMVVPSMGGVINRPCFKKGPERHVPNHLAIVEKGKKSLKASLRKLLAFLLPAGGRRLF